MVFFLCLQCRWTDKELCRDATPQQVTPPLGQGQLHLRPADLIQRRRPKTSFFFALILNVFCHSIARRMQTKTPILFCRQNSTYQKFDNVDIWTEKRNALNFVGLAPIVAHPPCRLWGKLKHFSKAPQEEKALGIFAVNLARLNGGVVEHPSGSQLFKFMDCGTFKAPDEHGGFVISLDQSWYGHPCKKSTLLYICGIDRMSFTHPCPSYQLHTHAVCGRHKTTIVKASSRRIRLFTPYLMAEYLISLARLAQHNPDKNPFLFEPKK